MSMSTFLTLEKPLDAIRSAIDGITTFLNVSLSVANAHTVDFYTRDVWKEYIALPPDKVLSVIDSSHPDQTRALQCVTGSTFGFCKDTERLVDVSAFVSAARSHSLPGLGVCVSLAQLHEALRVRRGEAPPAAAPLEPHHFMNSKKCHEVEIMAEVVAALAGCCGLRQVIDVGSGKGYLCSYLSLQYNLEVYGIDSSSSNTHGAHERNRKLQKYSPAYRRPPTRPTGAEEVAQPGSHKPRPPADHTLSHLGDGWETQELFLNALSPELVELSPSRCPPTELAEEEKERRKRENMERKGQSYSNDHKLFSPLTSYVTAHTELRDIITELEDAALVGLHTCGDLAASTLRMFVSREELRAVCSVGCCYHLLSEEFISTGEESRGKMWGFPMSQYLRERAWVCGRNARMSACLALERVTVGRGLPIESLFYRAVLHVILRDHFAGIKSEKRVGNVYSKATCFVDYVRRALRKLDLDESKLSDDLIQRYLETYEPRMKEMEAFNMLKVSLAPCIEGLILLDRLCYLKEQQSGRFCALVQLFDPLMSPRCYGVVALKEQRPT